MAFVWFLVGLSLGLAMLGWYYIQLNAKLKRLTHHLQPDLLRLSFSPTSKLTRAIVAYSNEHLALRQQLDIWQQIYQSSPVGFIQVDQDNHLIWCNANACEILHIQFSDTSQPRLLLEVVRSYELDRLIEQTRASAQPQRWEWTFNPVFSDPSVLSQQLSCPIRAYSLPLPGEHVGVFLENRQEAVSMAQQRDRWISDVAHELKTPLTSIRLVAETLQMRLEPPLRDWVDRLLKEAVRLSHLVQDLLDLSQLEARPTPTLNCKTIDLTKLIQSAWLGLEPLARRKQLELDYRGPSQLLIQADESRLHRALLNLLDNSIKYSPTQQKIQVQLTVMPVEETATNQPVCLEVIDAGPGFPEAALPHVFDRFYRVDPSRTRYTLNANSVSAGSVTSDASEPSTVGSSGSGLGLAIVRQIIEAHGGIVRASNHPETGGAWLQVFLPLEGEKG